MKVATTSSGVSGVPSWNRTLRRIWNVHVFALFDAFHDVAIRGTRREFLSAKTSCSPAMCETASAPRDWSSGGSSEPSAFGEPMRRVPAVVRARACGAAVASGTPATRLRNGIDMPSTEPRWISSRRVTVPSRYSSISSFSSSPALFR